MCGRAAVNVPPSPSSMHHPRFRTLEFLNPKHSWMTLGPGNPLWKYAFYKELPDTTDQYFKSICCFRHPPRKIGLSFSKVQSSAGREKTNQPNPPQPNNKQMQKNPKWSPRETKSLDGTASDTQNNLCSFYNLTLILQQLKLYMLQSNKLLERFYELWALWVPEWLWKVLVHTASGHPLKRLRSTSLPSEL